MIWLPPLATVMLKRTDGVLCGDAVPLDTARENAESDTWAPFPYVAVPVNSRVLSLARFSRSVRGR